MLTFLYGGVRIASSVALAGHPTPHCPFDFYRKPVCFAVPVGLGDAVAASVHSFLRSPDTRQPENTAYKA